MSPLHQQNNTEQEPESRGKHRCLFETGGGYGDPLDYIIGCEVLP